MQNLVKGFRGKENMMSKNLTENVVFDIHSIHDEIANMKINVTLKAGDYEIEVECYN